MCTAFHLVTSGLTLGSGAWLSKLLALSPMASAAVVGVSAAAHQGAMGAGPWGLCAQVLHGGHKAAPAQGQCSLS